VREIERMVAGSVLTAHNRLPIPDSGQHCFGRSVK
jgi:hypothetical protein